MGAVCSENSTLSSFLDACDSGDLDHIRNMEEMSALDGIINEGFETGLSLACRKNNAEIVRFLLRNDNIDPNKGFSTIVESAGGRRQHSHQFTPLFVASEMDDPSDDTETVIKLLLGHEKIRPNDGVVVFNMNGKRLGVKRTPLTVAAEKRNYGIVELLLKKDDVDPTMIDNNDQLKNASLLYYLCRDNRGSSMRILENLLSWDDFQPRESLNPLFPAIEKGHKEIVKMLLEFTPIKKFINRGLNGCWGKNSLYFALESGEFEIADMLISFPITNLDGSPDFRPLHLCCEKGYIKVVEKILEKGKGKVKRVNVNMTLKESGQTSLHIACSHNQLNIVKLLLKQKKISRSVQRRDKNRKLPVDLASKEEIKILFSSLKFKKKKEEKEEVEGENET